MQVWRSKEEKKGGASVRQISLSLTVGKWFSSVVASVYVLMYKQYRFHLTQLRNEVIVSVLHW